MLHHDSLHLCDLLSQRPRLDFYLGHPALQGFILLDDPLKPSQSLLIRPVLVFYHFMVDLRDV